MYTWRGGLCHDDLHLAKGTSYYHTTPWGSCKPDQAHSTQSLNTYSLKAYSGTHRDPVKPAAVPTMQQHSDIGTVDQCSYNTAGRLEHKASQHSHSYDMPFGMSCMPFGMSPEDHPVAAAHSGSLPLSPASAAQHQLGSTINASLLAQVLAQSANVHACATSTRLKDAAATSMGWSLGTAKQQDASSAASAASSVNMPEINDLLSQSPADQYKLLLDNLASSTPQELLLATQAAATASAAAGSHATQPAHGRTVNAHLMQQDAMTASNSSADGSHQLLQQLLLQASLAAQQAALSSGMPDNAQDQLLQQYAAAVGSGSPANLGLLQLLVQQQAVAATSPEQQQFQAMLLASMGAGLAPTSAAHGMPAFANRRQQQQQAMYGASSSMCTAWPAAAVADAAGAPSPSVAAVLAQQQHQQQLTLACLMAEAASLAAQQQQTQAALLAAGAAGGQYNQLALQLMASQLAASAPSTVGLLGNSPSANLITRLGGSAGTHGNPRIAAVQSLGPTAHQQSGFGLTDIGNNAPGKGRRSRSSNNSSRASSTGLGMDIFGPLGSTASSISSRAASVAGSDFDSNTDNITAAADVVIADLCPSKFEDYWGASDVVSSCESTRSRAASDAVSSWPYSSSNASSPVSSRDGSATAESWQSDDEHPTAAAAAAFASLSLGAASATPGKGNLHAAVNTPSSDQGTVQMKADSSPEAAAAGKVGGCTVWFPGFREASGDDSWYLPLPKTCRLFVGNIGSWVDEDMLTAYFGKYGNVVDVQVMWNTKMLARGRRVNREFAFISYSTSLEAARAVHWLDGCRLVDLEKDKNGITVEYENGESDARK